MSKPIVVMKFGGSSLADVDKIRNVATIVSNRHKNGEQVVVVVSATGKTTDDLLKLASSISSGTHKRELDMLLTAGERISMALLAMAIKDKGINAISFTGSQCGIITNDNHFNARIIEVRPFRVQDELDKGQIVIVAGFQGVSYKKEITTLGRGGSDTTAVALSAALNANGCEIYSDVDGVYTADPRIVDPFRLIDLNYSEMMEMAYRGAKVLNFHAVEFARRKNIAIYARSSSGGGETVVRKITVEKNGPVSVTSSNTLLGISFQSEENLMDLLQIFKNEEIKSKYTVFTNRGGLIFIDISTYPSVKYLSLENSVLCCSISIIGTGIEAINDIFPAASEFIKKNNIEILAIETGHTHLTFYINSTDDKLLVKEFHKLFIENSIQI
ncbi:MAG: aspartate kinase [Deltaproteobacteria bacterium]|nr:aspartate kinase [Deltaproteobacteria bacterium]